MTIVDAISWLQDMAEDLEDEIDEGYGTESNECKLEALQMAISVLRWVKEIMKIVE